LGVSDDLNFLKHSTAYFDARKLAAKQAPAAAQL